MNRIADSLRNRKHLIWPGVLASLGLAFALVPLSQGQLFFYWDNAQQHYPQTVFLQNGLREGRIPEWSPGTGLGFPTVAEGQAAHYHPLRLLFALAFSPVSALMWEIGFCLALGGAFTYLFLREFGLLRPACFLAGMCQMFSAPSLISIHNLGLHRSLCMLPLGMLLAERFVRRRGVTPLLGISCVVALQLLSGHPVVALMTMVGTTFFVLARVMQRSWHTRDSLPMASKQAGKALAGWVVFVALGFGLAAIQVVPTSLHVGHSIRQGGLSFQHAAASLPARLSELPQAAFPYAYEHGVWLSTPKPWDRQMNLTQFSSMYIGTLALLLAWLAVWHWRPWPDPTVPFVACFMAATALALGPTTPLFPALWSFPGMSGFRISARFLLVSSFFLACLAAMGMHHLAGASRLRRRGLRSFLPVLLCLLVIAVIGARLWLRKPDFRMGIELSFLLWLATAGLVWILLRSRQRRSFALLVLVLAALADLWTFRRLSEYAGTMSEKILTPPPLAEFMKAEREPFRVLSLPDFNEETNRTELVREFLQANLCTVWGIDSADLWASLHLARNYAVRESIVWELRSAPASAMKLAGYLGALNIKYIVAPNDIDLNGWDRAFQTNAATTWRNPSFLPRAFLVGKIQPENTEIREAWTERANIRLERYRSMVRDWWSRRADSQIVDHVLERGVDYRRTAVISSRDLPALSGSEVVGEVTNLTSRREPDVMRFHVQSNSPAFLVISTTYAPGWSATVNGQPTRIYRTNWLLQGVMVPAGKAEVVLRFSTPGLRLGGLLSLLSFMLLALLWILLRRSSFALPAP